jgi:argininosuccinate lyase
VHFSRIAEDLILWSTAEFRFIDLPDAFCTGSSLMPQKKNPTPPSSSAASARAWWGNLQTLLVLVKVWPLTLQRDLQEDKPPLFDSHDTLVICAEVLAATLAGAKVRADACAAAVADPHAPARANRPRRTTSSTARAVRDAHHAVGALVNAPRASRCAAARGAAGGRPQKIHKEFAKDWPNGLQPRPARMLARRGTRHAPHPKQVKQQLSRWRKALAE